MSDDGPHGLARWYVWDGGFLAVGHSRGVVPPHSHHAIQLCLGLDRPVRIRDPESEWRSGGGFLVRPDAPHSFDGDGVPAAMLFVEPESLEGRWVLGSVTSDIMEIPAARLERIRSLLITFAERPLEALEPEPLILEVLRALSAGPPPQRKLDERVERVLEMIHASKDLRISLEDAAAAAFLSPSRFAHLFTAHVGLPFRRYLLWRKLLRAIVAHARGRTLTAAAHEGGFADAAHFTRTFHQMFGITPSAMMQGEFFVIDSPFAG